MDFRRPAELVKFILPTFQAPEPQQLPCVNSDRPDRAKPDNPQPGLQGRLEDCERAFAHERQVWLDERMRYKNDIVTLENDLRQSRDAVSHACRHSTKLEQELSAARTNLSRQMGGASIETQHLRKEKASIELQLLQAKTELEAQRRHRTEEHRASTDRNTEKQTRIDERDRCLALLRAALIYE